MTQMKVDPKDIIHVDGSVLEGGGQLLRLAIVFSSILGKPIHVSNIRQHRKSPGLAAEHVTAINLAREMCKADVKYNHKNSMNLTFYPRNLTKDEFWADTQGCGSVTLIMQLALPLAMFGAGISRISIKGATNTYDSPSMDYFINLWDPLTFKHFGTNMEIRDIRRGFYPKGRGEVFVEVYPVQYLRAIDLTEFESVVTAWGRAICTTQGDWKKVQTMGDIVEEYLLTVNRELYHHMEINREELSEREAYGNGSGIYVFAETTSRAIIGTGYTIQKYRDHNATALLVAKEFANLIAKKVCVDDYTQDQLILLMALAKGKSRIKTGNITLHTKTAIHVAELMSHAKFHIIDNKDGTNIIECQGIGLENKLITRSYV